MKFGVIGEPCVDFIHKPGEHTIKRLGGILYSISSLAIISGNEHEIYPIMYLGYDEYDFITSFLSGFSNINLISMTKTSIKFKINHAGLKYKGLIET